MAVEYLYMLRLDHVWGEYMGYTGCICLTSSNKFDSNICNIGDQTKALLGLHRETVSICWMRRREIARARWVKQRHCIVRGGGWRRGQRMDVRGERTDARTGVTTHKQSHGQLDVRSQLTADSYYHSRGDNNDWPTDRHSMGGRERTHGGTSSQSPQNIPPRSNFIPWNLEMTTSPILLLHRMDITRISAFGWCAKRWKFEVELSF